MYIDEQPEIIQGVCQADVHVVTGEFVRSTGTKSVLGPNCMMPYIQIIYTLASNTLKIKMYRCNML